MRESNRPASDVFGTVVDWHTSVSRDLAEFAAERDVTGVDWVHFAEEWRKLYNPAMEEVRSGRREWTVLDVLHREGLVTLLDLYDIDGFDEGEIDAMNRAWHRLDPWPDAVPGLLRLKTKYVIAPCSNGNIALIVNMAKRRLAGRGARRRVATSRSRSDPRPGIRPLAVEVLMVARTTPTRRRPRASGLQACRGAAHRR